MRSWLPRDPFACPASVLVPPFQLQQPEVQECLVFYKGFRNIEHCSREKRVAEVDSKIKHAFVVTKFFFLKMWTVWPDPEHIA